MLWQFDDKGEVLVTGDGGDGGGGSGSGSRAVGEGMATVVGVGDEAAAEPEPKRRRRDRSRDRELRSPTRPPRARSPTRRDSAAEESAATTAAVAAQVADRVGEILAARMPVAAPPPSGDGVARSKSSSVVIAPLATHRDSVNLSATQARELRDHCSRMESACLQCVRLGTGFASACEQEARVFGQTRELLDRMFNFGI